MNIKKEWPLIAGVAIPCLMVIFISAAIYLPGRNEKPQYDFIYSSEGYSGNRFMVEGGLLREVPLSSSTPAYYYDNARLYLYDVERGSSREISAADARMFHLDTSTRSPDGFEVVRGGSGGFFPFFWDGSGSDIYLKGDRSSRRIENINLSYNFRFLGWIIK